MKHNAFTDLMRNCGEAKAAIGVLGTRDSGCLCLQTFMILASRWGIDHKVLKVNFGLNLASALIKESKSEAVSSASKSGLLYKREYRSSADRKVRGRVG